MSIHHKRGVRGYQPTRCFQIQFWKRQFKNMSSLTKPQLSTKGEGCKNPRMPYMAIVTSMVKVLTKCIHKMCDDQQDHTQ